MRGFVTIATGRELYYQLARNLLHSYRNLESGMSKPLPFAVICDRENEYTSEFDDVILMDSPSNSYMDKLMLYKYAPYEETVFIDADSLFFHDPDGLWTDFENQDDVSCYGVALPLDSTKAWFTYEGCGRYREQIQYLIDLHGGAYYIRKTERARQIFELAISLASEYDQYGFRNFDKPADEPVLAMAMAILHCRPCENRPRGGYLVCSKLPRQIAYQSKRRTSGCRKGQGRVALPFCNSKHMPFPVSVCFLAERVQVYRQKGQSGRWLDTV